MALELGDAIHQGWLVSNQQPGADSKLAITPTVNKEFWHNIRRLVHHRFFLGGF